jgi:hypothetical protein
MSGEEERQRAGLVLDSETEHAIKNHLAVIVGFSELLLTHIEPEDARHGDVQEIYRAAKELMLIFRREGRAL